MSALPLVSEGLLVAQNSGARHSAAGLKRELRTISDVFDLDARAVVYQGSCEDLLATIPDEAVKLVVTSPPYNPIHRT